MGNKEANKERIDIKDILQIAAGSITAAIVFAPTNEYRSLSHNLPTYKIGILFVFTIIFAGILAYFIGGRKLKVNQIRTIAYIIPIRIVIIYAIAVVSCLIALWVYDIINFNTSLDMIAREVVVLSLFATFGGTLLDLVYSKNR
jgi:uncharacterized membrane protein